MREIRRTVERIDVPPFCGVAGSRAAFFTDDRALREFLSQPVDDQALGGAICVRDEIGTAPFLRAVQRAMQVTHEQRARFARRFDRDLQRLRHGTAP